MGFEPQRDPLYDSEGSVFLGFELIDDDVTTCSTTSTSHTIRESFDEEDRPVMHSLHDEFYQSWASSNSDGGRVTPWYKSQAVTRIPLHFGRQL